MYIADLHIHSRFSRATSRDCDAPHLDWWARRKGIGQLGTGDFTHPAWRAELKEQLVPAGEGVYTLRDELRLPDALPGGAPRFVVTGEISSIYKRDGKTRKVHNLILLFGAEAADKPQKPRKERPKAAPAAEQLPEAPRADTRNPEQQAAVCADERTVAVVAGPGTGKTKTLADRIAYLIEERGAKPGEITAVTFTNQAAAEMRARLEQRLGGKRAAARMTIGTFHVICLRLLQNARLLGPGEALTAAQAAFDVAALRRALRGFGHLEAWLDRAETWLPHTKDKPRALVERWEAQYGSTPALARLRDTAVFHARFADLWDTLALGQEADLRRAAGKGWQSGAVRLMTLHGAKGLEFPAVFVCSLNAGNLPLESPSRPADIEEERRLLYVGMTRARDELILTTSGAPSAFAADLPDSVRRARAGGQREKRVEQISLF